MRAAATVLGVAFGAGPLLFLEGSGEARWTDPVGLVLGLSVVAMTRAVATVERGSVGRNKKRYAWVQVGIVSVSIVAAAVWSALPG
jgi:hypothetical protein